MSADLLSNPLFGICSDGRGIYIFGVEIYYYALCIVFGMLLAATLSALLMKRRNMSPDFIYLLFIVCIPTAIICARLFSCLTDPDLGLKRFFEFRSGGLSIIGGVSGGVIAGLVVCKIKKVEFFRAADCVVINILIAQAFGRWGNFFNAEVYGAEVTNPAMQWFPFAVPIVPGYSGTQAFEHLEIATWHYAFFFYELCVNMVGWALLFSFAWFHKKKPNGLPTFLYFAWYGILRTVLAPLRDPEFILSRGGVPWSLVFSVLMIGLGVGGCLALMIYNFKKEGAFLGSKTGDPCGITMYLTPYKNDEPYFSKINMFGANYPQRPPKKKKGEAAEERAEEPERKDGDSPENGESGGDGGADGEV